MTRFRKKPVVIDAEQFTGEWVRGMCDSWKCSDPALPYLPGMRQAHPHIHTLEGPLLVSKNDWIIEGVKGEFYPCKPDIFAATYEPVERPHPMNDPISLNSEFGQVKLAILDIADVLVT